jgi:NADPH-dependent 2,4-dienoyl-CoA reductase/sulfur reductase-like enzyme
MTAAGRAARLNPDLDIVVLEQGPHVSYSICGAPYYLSGEVPRVESLISYTAETFEQKRGVRVITRVRVEQLEPARRRVLAREVATGHEAAYDYDRLLLATGYRPVRLKVPGSNLRNIFTLTYLTDAEAIHEALGSQPRRALLIGGGLVNIEMAESLARRGIEITLVEKGSHILPGIDPEIAELAERELTRHGVRIVKERSVRTFFGNDQGEVHSAWLDRGEDPVQTDLVVVDIGVRPETTLAEAAGIALGRSGAIAVTPELETSVPGIFAAGNCAEAIHLVSNQPVFNGLGTAANKQGRIAGENLAGQRSSFRGVLNTWVVRIFDLCVARTGLNHKEAVECGFQPVSVQISAPARAAYMSESSRVAIRAIADRSSRRLLGLQAAGEGADKRVDVAAVALTNGMKVEDAAQLDLGYAPPYSQVWDPFLIAMNQLLRELSPGSRKPVPTA